MTTGSEFVREFGPKGPMAWEGAALALARMDGLTPWPWVDLKLTDGQNSAVLKVQSDVLSIGPTQDYVRLPLTPSAAQNILNLYGRLLPTPWLAYQMYRQAPVKLQVQGMVPNKGPNMKQYAEHSAFIDQQMQAAGAAPGSFLSGTKKHIVVSNIYHPHTVLIFGWYKPPPWPDVYDDGSHWKNPTRQPQQVKSNAHADGYVDYSHGVQAIGPVAYVNAPGIFVGEMPTVDLYQHPILSKLVSNEGPLRMTRYPSVVVPATNRPTHETSHTASVSIVPTSPSIADQGLQALR